MRAQPALDVLIEVGQMDLKPPSRQLSNSQLIRLANGVINGKLGLAGFPDEDISPVFSPADLHKGSLKWRLIAASLAGVDYLLEAYRLTGREEYFQLARANILAFADFEASRWLDTGFLWNDHAIAARISVLIKFWGLYRDRQDFDPETARTVLSLVARSGMLLAKPEHYAWRTGHGMVSNIALLQIGVAFPHLKESRQFLETAQRRLAAHVPYYVNREGVTLLHSASYHIGGVRLLGMAMRLYTLGGVAIPPDWWERAQGAEDFLALLRRPDGTLPMFGDTGSDADRLDPERTKIRPDGSAAPLAVPGTTSHRGGMGLYPEAGYAVWWYPRASGDPAALSQTVAAWSNYPRLGHKHADDLSVIIWARSRSWFTNVGYWPYGLPGRLQAESWAGSNAPHLRGESALSPRTARMTAVARNEETFFLEMERHGPSGFKVKRQVLQVGAGTWIILDQFADASAREAEVYWTVYPDLRAAPGRTRGSFRFSAALSADTLNCSFQHSGGGRIDQLAGSVDPFGGWVVIGQTPTPATAIRVRSNTQQGWQLAVCSLSDQTPGANDRTVVAELFDVQATDRWTVQVAGSSGSAVLTAVRSGGHLSVAIGDAPANTTVLEVSDVPDAKAAIEPVLTALGAMAESSVRRVPLIPYRTKVSYALLVLLLIQEVLLYATRHRWPRLAIALRWASIIAWVGAGIWLTQFYLVAG